MEDIYAVVFMDAIHYHVRSEGRIVKRAVYIAIGIDMERHKDVLGMYVGQNESAKFWLSILNGSEEPWRKRYLNRLCRRSDRLSSDNRSCFPRYRDPTLYHSSDPKYNKVCFLKGTQAADG